MDTNKTNINEVDNMLTEKEQSLKKKIFKLSKMESLVHADPKLSTVYNDMAENGEEKYGYHYNETIMNIIFNDYVLNSPKYLQKYKMAIPKKKKRRDKSGINQLKKAGEEKMQKLNPELKQKKSELDENDDEATVKVLFLVNDNDPKNPDVFAYFPEENYDIAGKYKTAYSHIGQHSSCHPEYARESRTATPEEYADLKTELENYVGYNLEILNGMNETSSTGSVGGSGMGSGGYSTPRAWSSKGDLMGGGNPKRKPIWKGGTIIQESNYLIDPSGFEKYVNELHEQENIPELGTQEFNKGDKVFDILHNSHGIVLDNYGNPKDGDRGDIRLDSDGNVPIYQYDDKSKINSYNLIKVENMNEHHLETRKEKCEFIFNYLKNLKDGGLYDKEALDKLSDEEINQLYLDVEKDMGISEGNNITEKITTLEQLKTLGRKLTKDDVPNIAGEALYHVAISLANKYLPFGWNDLPDINSMWDYINENGGMTFNELKSAVKEAIDERLSEDGISLDDLMEQIKINEKSKSKAQQRFMGMVRGVQKGDIKASDVSDKVTKAAKNMKPKDVKDFAKTKHEDLPEKVNPETIVSEEMLSIIQTNPTSMSNKSTAVGDVSANIETGTKIAEQKLFEELKIELDAFSIHHKNLIKMTENRKPSALVLRDRVGSENEVNFKKDMKNSGTGKTIDIQKELQWKDQQTEVGDKPQKLGQDIEKNVIKNNDGTSFKNVGNSTNDNGDEIPKRNLTKDEMDEVELYRLGLGDYVYDNEPDERFEERMKKDMGEELYKKRQEKLKFRSKAPMYNKDTQPVGDESKIGKVQFSKEKSGWADRMGISETIVTGKYYNELGKQKLISFTISEAKETIAYNDEWHQIIFEGMGNTFTNDFNINENLVKTFNEYQFYVDNNKNIYLIQGKSKLTENEGNKLNASKMNHLINYKPNEFLKTDNIKKNRGF